MGLRKQILLSLAVLVGGFSLWIVLSPAAPAFLKQIGVPETLLAFTGKEKAKGADPAAPAGGGRRGGGAPTVMVVPVVNETINDQLSAIGTGEAIQSVDVTPQVTGPIAEVLVKSGDHVEKGQVLVRLDNAEQVIARDQAEVALKSAEEKANAYSKLTPSVGRLDVFNTQIAVETARLALQTAELNLSRRNVVAPITGISGIVTINPGDNVTTQTVIATLDNRSELLVDYWVPARFSNQLAIGQPVNASPVTQPGKVFPGSVEAIDNRIDQASRTLRIRARIPNGDDVLRAGMAFSVSMTFPGDTFPAVDPLAVQWDSAGAYVWQVGDDMKVQKARVRIVQRNPDLVLVASELKPGDKVVTEGLQRIREGAQVRIAGADDNGKSGGEQAGGEKAGGERPAVKP